ncbi:MAG TPA: tetratricopeptide repeat protein [Terracidiphilus sp.]|jgi:tetratricopeptide (TPR) repeat protein|nr:tetratricopeptide repeat protein [Terracidiphilus sp.]
MRLRIDGGLILGAALLGACGTSRAFAQDDPAQRALSLQRQGKIAEAEEEWKTIATQHPASAEPLAELGLLEARQEHYAEAIRWYKKAMALSPEMPRLRFNLGLAYFKAGEYAEALEQFKPLLKTGAADPDEAQRLTILVGMSHYGLGEFAAATPYLKRAADGDVQNLSLLLTLAHSCLLSHQYQCVLDEFHQIIALSPDSVEAHMLAGEALDEMKEPVDAVRELRAAVQADPKAPNVHFALGYVLWTQGHADEAAQEFQAEIDNDPQHIQAILYLADARIQMNQPEGARPLLEKVAKIDPTDPMVHLDLGIIYTDASRNADALRELKTAAALDPTNVKPHWRLARLYHSMGKTAEADAELTKTKHMNEAADEGLLKAMSRVSQQSSAPQGEPAKK